MKKLLLFISFLILTTGLFGQNTWENVINANGGIKVGGGEEIDTIALVGTKVVMYDNAGDTLGYYILYANRVDPDEISIPKNPDVATKTADYTLILTDEFDFIYMNLGTADTVFVPLNASVAFPLSTQITIVNLQAGATTISPIAGVTINSVGDAYDIKVNGMVTLKKYTTNVWMLIGAVE